MSGSFKFASFDEDFDFDFDLKLAHDFIDLSSSESFYLDMVRSVSSTRRGRGGKRTDGNGL